MARNSIKGMPMGSRSLSEPSRVELAQRVDVGFVCERGHHFSLPFAHDAVLPVEWECTRCGQPATRQDGTVGVAKEVKPTRTHWDMLRERRSIDELEVILAERLEALRADR